MVDDEDSADGVSQNLLCIARRVPYNEKHLSPPLEQFTIKLDQNGKILALDTKDVSDIYAQHLNKVKSKCQKSLNFNINILYIFEFSKCLLYINIIYRIV